MSETIHKFQIGDTVFWGCYESTAGYITCPDCGGTGRLRVIFFDDSEASIECDNCKRGWEGPYGKVRIFDRKPIVRTGAIDGISTARKAETEYSINTFYCNESEPGGQHYSVHVTENRVRTTHEEAMQDAIELADKDKREELERVGKKHNANKKWAWNASYHRREIKRAQRDIERHTAKLNVASLKAKEDKQPIQSEGT